MPIQLTKSGEPFKLYQGWGGVKHPEIIEAEFAKLSPQDFIGFYSLSAQEDTNRVALFEVTEKLLGSYLPSLEQEIGDSFLPGTMVRMGGSHEKPIEDVLVGDTVYTHKGVSTVIDTHKYKPKTDTILVLGVISDSGKERVLKLTPDHMLYVKGDGSYPSQWEMACNIEIGTTFESSDGHETYKLVDCYEEQYDGEVYCLSVYPDHSFVAEGILAHNCVSWGMKHAVELLQCCEILINGDREEFKRVFAPLIYGTSRVQIGGGRISGDGSVGSWAAEAVKKFGILFEDAEGCPPYSGSVARTWGKQPGPPQKFLDIAKAFPVKSTAAVTTWDELVAALFNFYPVTVASDIGYSMLPGNDGYHIQNTSWAHQMCIAGVDKGGDGIEPHAYIWNSWGNVHGRLKDFRTGKELPPGYLRARKRDIEKMLRQKDSWAISSFEGFKSRKLPKDLFIGM